MLEFVAASGRALSGEANGRGGGPGRPRREHEPTTFPLRRLTCGAVLAIGLASTATSCSETSVTGVEVHSVTVFPSQVVVVVGDTLRLQVTVRDEAGNVLPDRPVTWSSDDPDIATVEGGLVRGTGPGTAPIRASSGGAAGRSEVTVIERSSIVLSEGALAFQAMPGTGPTAPQTVGISTEGEAPLSGLQTAVSYASDDTGWLEATLAGTTAPTEVSLRADPTGLSLGTYRADVEVTASAADNSPQTIEVTFEVEEALPAIQVEPQSVSFAVAEGEGDPPPQVVEVTNSGGGDLTGLETSISYAEGEPTGWLRAELAATTAPTKLTLRVDPSALASGAVYEAVVDITSPAAETSGVLVRFSLGAPPPRIALDPRAIGWDIVENDDSPPTREVAIKNRGTRTLGGLSAKVVYGAGADGWLTAVIDRAVAPAVLTASLANTTLLPGNYKATIQVLSDDAINSPQSVAVSLRVAPRASPETSSITTSHGERVADGSSTAVITVELRDSRGDDMPSGGDEVRLFTTRGTLSSVSDRGDGTYRANLTSTTPGTATITGTVNDDSIDDDAKVQFVAPGPDEIEIEDGNNQTGTVGQELDDELEVRVTDSQDNPVSGVTVRWTPASGDGSADPTSSRTNSSGIATTNWTLGDEPGTQSLEASVSGVGSVTFNATAEDEEEDEDDEDEEEEDPDNIEIEAGNEQRGTVGQELDDPLQVRVTDDENNPVSGVTVSWTPASGDGSADPRTSQTNADGIATTNWTLGSSPGNQRLEASVAGVGSVTFSAIARPAS
jgi:hypothetical protein